MKTVAAADTASIADRTGFSPDAVESMARSIARGGGRMAQFDHPAFGGPGQWMDGGMLMISDPFDHALKQRVARLCAMLVEQGVDRETADRQTSLQGMSDEADVQSRVESRSAASTWYPAELGAASSSGAQNRTRYAWFAGTRRLAVDDGERVTVYDTGDHVIGGISQQQGGRGSVDFTGQHGPIDVASLPVIAAPSPRDVTPAHAAPDPFQALEKLASLHARGIVSDAEFTAKRIELLERI